MHALRKRRQGFTLIELMIVIELITILSALSLPNLIGTRRAADEASAIGSLKAINAAENEYRGKNNLYGTLAQLQSKSMIDSTLGAATGTGSTKSNFYFSVNGVSSSQYWVTAYRYRASTADRQFYTDEAAGIFAANAGAANPTGDTDGKAPNANFTIIGN